MNATDTSNDGYPDRDHVNALATENDTRTLLTAVVVRLIACGRPDVARQFATRHGVELHPQMAMDLDAIPDPSPEDIRRRQGDTPSDPMMN